MVKIFGRYYVEVDKIHEAGFNPTKRSEGVRRAALQESIHKYGILRDLAVTPDYTLIDGHRRLACAKALGITHVWVTVYEGDPAELFIEMNGTSRAISPAEYAEAYVKSGRQAQPIKQSLRRHIAIIEEELGEDAMAALVEAGQSPSLVAWVRRAADYCGDDSREFKRAVFFWMIARKQTYAMRRAIEDAVHPDILRQAIESGKDLKRAAQWVLSSAA